MQKIQQKMANAIRVLSADMIEKAKSGHPGMPLGMADVATVLWSKFLRFDPLHPDWINRDRFVLSNGHGSALLYSLLYLNGFQEATIEELKNFRQWGSKTAGHPEKGVLAGVDFSTGPLGQGIAGAVGLALAEKKLHAQFGDIISHKTYCFVGDGCLMEGISEEVIELAGCWKLNNLIVLWDDNNITIDGSTTIALVTNMRQRFEASGWSVLSCDGHDFASIESALTQAQTADKPVLIDCRTLIGYGAPTKSGKSSSHGSPLGQEELQGLKEKLEWQSEPFEIPQDIINAWRKDNSKREEVYQAWCQLVETSSLKEQFLNQIQKTVSFDLVQELQQYKENLIQEKTKIATRKSSLKVLNILEKHCPYLMMGSADLAAACFTKPQEAVCINSENYNGNYINYGIREHGMAGIMNGLAVHGGLIPLSSTFLSFVDYMKPAIRLASLMQEQIIYVLTHDSIGVGEDGPTHQPIEQLASLRATPGICVLRPCDSVEVAESYEIALQNQQPTVLVLSRQELPVLRETVAENLTKKGAYVIYQTNTQKERDITLIATGSEVSLAVESAHKLEEKNINVCVVSMPSQDLFERQSLSYKQKILGNAPRLIIEAGSSFGWDRYLGEVGAILSIDHFGASAPGKRVFLEFGFTAENVENLALDALELLSY